MIVVTGEFRIPESSLDAAREAMERVITATRAESGCLGYAYAQDVLEKGLFRIVESWVDRKSLDAHMAQPHMKRWQEERAKLGMNGRHVTIHEVAGSTAL